MSNLQKLYICSMKKIFCIFLISVLLSCDNSLDINDEWKDIPVIYGILNPGTDEPNSDLGKNENHYVRIQKSFLGEASANSYVDTYDSIYYNSSDLNVWLDIVNNQSGEIEGPFSLELITSDDLEEIELSKNDGLFHSDNHYLYKIPYVARDLTLAANDGDHYKINVVNFNSGDTAFAETNIVEPIDMVRPTQSIVASVLRFGSGFSEIIKINPSVNAKMYSITLRFNYWEQHVDDYLLDLNDNGLIDRTGAVLKYVEFNIGNIIATEQQISGQSSAYLQSYISPLQFFEFLAAQIKGDDYYRYPVGTYNQGNGDGITVGTYHRAIDLHVTAVNSELYTYINTNAPNYGFNQERPEYNNIENGIGHWSSRSILKLDSLRLDNASIDAISSDPITQDLNFACYNTNNIGDLDLDGFYLQFGEDCAND